MRLLFSDPQKPKRFRITKISEADEDTPLDHMYDFLSFVAGPIDSSLFGLDEETSLSCDIFDGEVSTYAANSSTLKTVSFIILLGLGIVGKLVSESMQYMLVDEWTNGPMILSFARFSWAVITQVFIFCRVIGGHRDRPSLYKKNGRIVRYVFCDGVYNDNTHQRCLLGQG